MIKKKLYGKCLEHIDQRIATAERAMNAAQSAANEESKSSVGDKYETGRAMMQQERDKNARQLAENLQIKQVLHQINYDQVHDTIQLGSLVETNQGNYYLAISAGKILLEGISYFAVSMATPIGQALQGKQQGEIVNFNGRQFNIIAVS